VRSSIEVTPGVVIAVAGWMLDPTTCTSLTLGPPQASIEALTDLHCVLVSCGHRGTSCGVHHTDSEASDEDNHEIDADAADVGRTSCGAFAGPTSTPL
jgi:hypothetical protein